MVKAANAGTTPLRVAEGAGSSRAMVVTASVPRSITTSRTSATFDFRIACFGGGSEVNLSTAPLEGEGTPPNGKQPSLQQLAFDSLYAKRLEHRALVWVRVLLVGQNTLR